MWKYSELRIMLSAVIKDIASQSVASRDAAIRFAVCVFTAMLFAAGCGREPGPGYRTGEVSIAYLKSLYDREPVIISGDVYVSGRVVSTDRYGNFYKTLVLQDETGGIVVRIDLENYHRTYFRGMRLRVACNALVLSSYGGTLQLGAYSYQEGSPDPGYISANRLPAVITIESGDDIIPEPLTLTIPDLDASHIGRFVAFLGVQFDAGELGETWSEADADTDRRIVDPKGNALIIRTSRYAEFSGRQLPSGSGYVEGVATVFNGAYQLTLCSESSAVMESPRF